MAESKAARRSLIETSEIKKLITACRNGDINAYRAIYEQYGDMLYSIAFRLLGNKEDSEDALQNTFIKLYRHLDQFRFESKFSSYLVRILINTCHDLQNKRNGLLQIFETVEINQDQDQDMGLTLNKAIQMLPEKMRECFVLFAVEGFKQNEIAEMLEINEGTVKAHIFQAKAKLREIIKTTV